MTKQHNVVAGVLLLFRQNATLPKLFSLLEVTTHLRWLLETFGQEGAENVRHNGKTHQMIFGAAAHAPERLVIGNKDCESKGW